MIAGRRGTGAGLGLPTILMLLLVALGTACENTPAEPIAEVPVASVEVLPPELELEVGDTLTLHAVPRSASGAPLLDRTVSWSSLTPGRASVSAGGRVLALSAGTVTIRATAGGVHGTSEVTVADPGAPAPVVTELSPASASAGGAAFALTVLGTGFAEGSRVLWAGEARPTTRVSATRLTAQVAAADIADAGTVEVRVESGGALSGAATFTVNAPGGGAPVLHSLSPASVPAGSEGFTLVVRGAGFAYEAAVLWNGSPRTTTRVSETELRAEISVSDVWEAGVVPVSVRHTGGGGPSGALPFQVASSGIATITLSPDTLFLDPGEEAAFDARVLALDGAPVGGRYRAWSSVNGTIAEIFGDGTVRAVRPGTTNVRLAISDKAATATVVVGPYPVHYVTLDRSEAAVLVGEQVQLHARVFAYGGVELHDREVTWTVDDPAIATVDGEGRVTGRRKGRTRVHAESEGKSTWAILDVREWPAGALWTFDLKADPLVVRPPVGDTTWVDGQGRTHRADLYLTGAALTIDRVRETYVQSLELLVVEEGVIHGTVTREDRGTARSVSWPEAGLLFASSRTAGYTFTGAITGPGEVTLQQKVGTDVMRPYLYVIR